MDERMKDMGDWLPDDYSERRDDDVFTGNAWARIWGEFSMTWDERLDAIDECKEDAIERCMRGAFQKRFDTTDRRAIDAIDRCMREAVDECKKAAREWELAAVGARMRGATGRPAGPAWEEIDAAYRERLDAICKRMNEAIDGCMQEAIGKRGSCEERD